MDPIKEALTFDDVTLAPQYSKVLPSDVSTKTILSNQLKLESAVQDQKAVIQEQKISYEKILEANKKLNITI